VQNCRFVQRTNHTMPKQRQTCTRCSQRRQKCDRKAPCTRCVQNNEGHLCTTKWVNGYNPNVHRKYPRRPSPTVSSGASSSDTSSSGPRSNEQQSSIIEIGHNPDRAQIHEVSIWPTKLPDITIGALLNEKDQDSHQGIFDKSFTYAKPKGTLRDGVNGPISIANCYSNAAKVVEIQHLQSILPWKEKVMLIVDYYERYMTYWFGGIYHAPSFRKKLLEAYGQASDLDLQSLEWKWVALLCKSFPSTASDVANLLQRSQYTLLRHHWLFGERFSLMGLLNRRQGTICPIMGCSISFVSQSGKLHVSVQHLLRTSDLYHACV
jgi:hypothetical protein